MTPEQYAERVDIVVDEVGNPNDPQNYVNHEATEANIAVAIRQAVAEERDRCLRHAEAWADTKAGADIARRILEGT